MSDDTAFPRGRSRNQPEDPPSQQQGGKKREKPENDILFGQKQKAPETTKSSRKKRKTEPTTDASGATSMLPLGGGGVIAPNQKKKEALIESISFQKLAKGTKLLGIVREINDKFALVSLPNLLTGYILFKESDHYPLTVALQIGQILAVYIVKTATEIVGTGSSQTNRKRIQLSIAPHHLNGAEITKDAPCRGQVTSVEDHGIVVSLGNQRTGFLKFEDIAGEYCLEGFGEDNHDTIVNKRFIHEGRVLDFVVKPEKTTVSVIPLALPSPTKMAKTALPTTYHPPLSDLNPGSFVNVKVESLARNGLCVSFLGGVFRGSIDWNHFGAHWRAEHRQPNIEWKTVFDEIRNTPARIIAVDAKTKLVRLSLQSHLLAMRCITTTLPAVGSTIQNATVLRVDPGVGALFALPEEYNIEQPKLMDPLAKHESYVEASKVLTAYVHISKAVDGRMTEAEFAKDFAPSTTHTIRIMSNNNWMEGVATCAAAPSIVEAHVLTHSDLETGKIYRAVPVCGQLTGGSIMVDFGMGVKGLIPSHHLFDKACMTSEYRLKLRKEKFAIGNKIDVRVLELDASQRKCTLTAKKSLLKAKDCLTSYDDIQVGQHATGFISKIEDRAFFVTFYNRVYGRVTARSLAAELGVENIRESYSMGDVLTCRVISCRRRVGKNRREYEDEDINAFTVDSKSGYWDLNLSLNMNEVVTNEDQQLPCENSTSGQVILQAGAVLPPKSMKVVEIVSCSDKKRGGEFVPGHAIVRIKTKYLLKNKDEFNVMPHIDCKLPFDQLLDSYQKDDIESKEAMDKFATKHLTVGTKLNCKGLVLTDPKKSNDEYSSGIGKLPILSLRLKLIETAETQSKRDPEDKEDATALILPSTNTHLFMGAYVQGYVAQADPRHGSFVRFLDGLTGLVPKLKKGLELSKFETVSCKIVALDVTTSPMKILLKSAGSQKTASENRETPAVLIKPGDNVGSAEIVEVNFLRASMNLLDEMFLRGTIRARLHVTMTHSEPLDPPTSNKKVKPKCENKITKNHPFYTWKKGQKLSNLTCVAVHVRKGVTYVELTNKIKEKGAESSPPLFVDSVSELNHGMIISAIVTAVPKSLRGLWVQVSPGVTAFIPSLELSKDVDVLNDLSAYFPVGSTLRCQVMNKQVWQKKKHWGEKMPQLTDDGEETKKSILESKEVPFLSFLLAGLEDGFSTKPLRGDLMVGRVDHSLRQQRAPALMLELRGGFTGRCCITELDEPDDWVNMPLGRIQIAERKTSTKVNVNENEDCSEGDIADMDVEDHEIEIDARTNNYFPHGKYVQCRVVSGVPSQPMVEVSVRQSRLDGDLDDDQLPVVKDTVQAFVVETNRKGCFVRLSRSVQGRVILKELSDGFLPDPATSFQMGRLVAGKVKEVHHVDKKDKKYNKATSTVDLDMRESVLLDSDDKVVFDDVQLGGKHNATVTRLEEYGVFVRLENSDVSGLVHKSECSDKFIKNLSDMYDPGDLVKVLVVKKDKEGRKVGFSMKASHFENDEDSEDSASMKSEVDEMDDQEMENDLDSDDENFMTKLASKNAVNSDDEDAPSPVDNNDDSGESNDDRSDHDNSDGSDSESDMNETKLVMDTNVGFDWGTGQEKLDEKSESTDDEDSEDSDGDDDSATGKGHSSRKKGAVRRREEQVTTKRESALADGTADENPETAADFDRLLASEPNNSEHWIRFMAFHLSLADLESARRIAQRALDRIDFRQEREKLNVWTALLTMELKYGSAFRFQETIDKACQNNNPKQVYLRVCEILEKEKDASASSLETTTRADDMFNKMCKKFRSKKTVWIAHLKYLLQGGRHQEGQVLLKRALTSLPEYKHVETMSNFAQLEFDCGSIERGRTIFDGLLEKYQKRMDLLFVYVDKEVKAGEFTSARALLDRTSSTSTKLSSKQMKSLFKKWYCIEELYGDKGTQEYVKDSARLYVERTSL